MTMNNQEVPPLSLICFYTSGMMPVSSQLGLDQHDDWGLKYISPQSPLNPIKKWEGICENICQEAYRLFKYPSNKEGLMVRCWQSEEIKIVAFAVADIEMKNFRDNILVVVFQYHDSLSVTKILSTIQINEEYFPEAVRSVKNQPHITITQKPNPALEIPLFLLHGLPLTKPPSTVETLAPRYPQHKMKSLAVASNTPWYIAATMAIIACLTVFWNYQTPKQKIASTAIISKSKDRSLLPQLQKKNIHLNQQLDLLQVRFDRQQHQLQTQNAMAEKIGGWFSLQRFADISRKYNIEGDSLEREIQAGIENNKKLKNIKNNLQRLLDYFRRERGRFPFFEMKVADQNGEKVEVKVLSAMSMKEIERHLQQILAK